MVAVVVLVAVVVAVGCCCSCCCFWWCFWRVSASRAGAIKWYGFQCISATGAGGAAGVGTDVVLVAVEPHISSPGNAGGICQRLINNFGFTRGVFKFFLQWFMFYNDANKCSIYKNK